MTPEEVSFDRFVTDSIVGILEGEITLGDLKKDEGNIGNYIRTYFDDVENRELELNKGIEDLIEGLVKDYDVSIHDTTEYKKTKDGIITRFASIGKSPITGISYRTKGLIGRVTKIFSSYAEKTDADTSGFRLIVQHPDTPSINFVDLWLKEDKQALVEFLKEYNLPNERISLDKPEFKELFDRVVCLYREKFERQNEIFQDRIRQRLEDTIEMLKRSCYPFVYLKGGKEYRFSAKRQRLRKLGEKDRSVDIDLIRFGIYEGGITRTEKDREMDIEGAKEYMSELKKMYDKLSLKKMSIKPSNFTTDNSSINQVHIFGKKEKEICIALRRDEFISVYTGLGKYDVKQFFEDIKQMSQKMFDDKYFRKPKFSDGIVSKYGRVPGQNGYLAHNHTIGFIDHVSGWDTEDIQILDSLVLKLNGVNDDTRPSILHSPLINYVKFPKSNGYTGLQGIVVINDKKVEVQLRTPLQHWIDEEGPAKKLIYDIERTKDFQEGFLEWCKNYKPKHGKEVSKRRVNDAINFKGFVVDGFKKEYIRRFNGLFDRLKNSCYNGKVESINETLELLSAYNVIVKIDFPGIDLQKELVISNDFGELPLIFMHSQGYNVIQRVNYTHKIVENLGRFGVTVLAGVEEKAKQLYFTKIVDDMENLSGSKDDTSRVTALSMLFYLKGAEGVNEELRWRISNIEEERFQPIGKPQKKYKGVIVPKETSTSKYNEWRTNSEDMTKRCISIMRTKGMDENLVGDLTQRIKDYLKK